MFASLCPRCTQILTQLPANGFGKAKEDGPGAWAFNTHVGGADELPDSWPQGGTTLPFAGIPGLKQQ